MDRTGDVRDTERKSVCVYVCECVCVCVCVSLTQKTCLAAMKEDVELQAIVPKFLKKSSTRPVSKTPRVLTIRHHWQLPDCKLKAESAGTVPTKPGAVKISTMSFTTQGVSWDVWEEFKKETSSSLCFLSPGCCRLMRELLPIPSPRKGACLRSRVCQCRCQRSCRVCSGIP